MSDAEDYEGQEHDEAASALPRQPPIPAEQAEAELARAVSVEGLRLEMTAGYLDRTYDVKKPIGKGKFSTVYKAIRKDDGLVVALKQIAFFDMLDVKSREKCLKEIKLVQSLEHPNIIRYLDGFVEEQVLYLVFEYAEAGDLKRQIRKAVEREARFDERVVWKYFSQIAEAVSYMHSKRVMHRDLKPANIFLTLTGQVKVGDLGLGRFLSEETLVAQSRVGTPLYMSPEVLRGHGYDWSSDVWSLGCLLYELAMLRNPFKEEGLNLYGLFAKISEGQYAPPSRVYSDSLRALVDACLQLEPTARPTAEQVAAIAVEMRETLIRSRLQASGAAGAEGGPPTTPITSGTPTAAQPSLPTPVHSLPTPVSTPVVRSHMSAARDQALLIGVADRRGPVVAEHWPELRPAGQRAQAPMPQHTPISRPGDDSADAASGGGRALTQPQLAGGGGRAGAADDIRTGGPSFRSSPSSSQAFGSNMGPMQATAPLWHAQTLLEALASSSVARIRQLVHGGLHSPVRTGATTLSMPLHAAIHDALVAALGGPQAVQQRIQVAHAQGGGEGARGRVVYDYVVSALNMATQHGFPNSAGGQDIQGPRNGPARLMDEQHAALLIFGGLTVLLQPGSLQELSPWLHAVIHGHEAPHTLWSIWLQSLLPMALQGGAGSARHRQTVEGLYSQWTQVQAGLGLTPRVLSSASAVSGGPLCAVLVWLTQAVIASLQGPQASPTASPDITQQAAGQIDDYEDDFEEGSGAAPAPAPTFFQAAHQGAPSAQGQARERQPTRAVLPVQRLPGRERKEADESTDAAAGAGGAGRAHAHAGGSPRSSAHALPIAQRMPIASRDSKEEESHVEDHAKEYEDARAAMQERPSTRGTEAARLGRPSRPIVARGGPVPSATTQHTESTRTASAQSGSRIPKLAQRRSSKEDDSYEDGEG